MTQKISQHSWEKSRKKGTRTTKMSNGFLQKLWMMGETSIYSLEEEPRQELMKQDKI
jgi:hypothetical protein